nr:immunoglobulin light chain junction region [Macaca mulatta]MOV78404.1 immunoglobulin light chain junction region [Macaca mulatta]MOV78573.1 immunoglobulin light chain junction region [Macaca mulatta]MOV78800.1 immunoglobulin light chain junction region [Macaca mulatta]MOV80103.1 immunoglobulin light chain junction region [Macaca mulatta]
CMQGKEFPYSF